MQLISLYWGKRNKRTLIAAVFVFVLSALVPQAVVAQTASAGRGFVIGGMVFVGIAVAALVFATWAIFQFRKLAADDPTATRMRTFAILGGGAALICFLIAFILFIVGRRQRTVLPPPQATSTIAPPSLGFSSGSIERHTPRKNAVNVPRNTALSITFREALDPATIIDTHGTPTIDDDTIRVDAIVLRPKNGGAAVTLRGKLVLPQGRTVIAKPGSDLGTAETPVEYLVEVRGVIQKKRGGSVLPVGTVYGWTFTTGTQSDALPPRILAVRPASGGTAAPNSAVQVVFSEPIDPTTLGLTASGRAGIELKKGEERVDGSWLLGPDGQTAEFLPAQECGTNACGMPIFCLPMGATLTLLAHPASVTANPPEAKLPYDGIVDLAGNSLDGNGNGRAEGIDDLFRASLTTLTTIDRNAPVILDVQPPREAVRVDPRASIDVLFSKPILTQSVTATSIALEGIDTPVTYRFEDAGGRTRVIIDHEPFPIDRLIAPVVFGTILDTTQNCFQPCTGPGTPLAQCMHTSPTG